MVAWSTGATLSHHLAAFCRQLLCQMQIGNQSIDLCHSRWPWTTTFEGRFGGNFCISHSRRMKLRIWNRQATRKQCCRVDKWCDAFAARGQAARSLSAIAEFLFQLLGICSLAKNSGRRRLCSRVHTPQSFRCQHDVALIIHERQLCTRL